MTIAEHMFHLGLPVAEKMLRPIVVYFFLIAGLRLAGKRELAQLNPFDLVVLLTLSNTVQNAIIGDDNSVTGGLLGAATLLVVNNAVVRFLYAHDKLEQLVEGAPDVLIENGVIRPDRLREELITLQELEAAGAEVPPDTDERHVPRARFHAQLAVNFGPADAVEPLYLRVPDADRTIRE